MNKNTLIVALIALIVINLVVIECGKRVELKITRKNKLREYMNQKREEFPHLYRFNTVVPLKGNETKIGEYYVDVYLGSNKQHFTTQLDTGSSDLAIPDIQCDTCGRHPDAYYDASQSSDASTISCSSKAVACPKCSSSQCSYSISYGDGSGFDASVYQDDMVFGGLNAKQYFGAITNEHAGQGQYNFEPYPVDGIMGFAYGSISEIQAPTVFETLVNAKQIDDVFSICLNSTGGALTLGAAGGHTLGNYQYTPIIQEQFYTVYLKDLNVFSSSIGVDPNIYNRFGAIVDSGTTLLILPSKAYDGLHDALSAQCNNVNLVGVCHTFSGKSIFDGYCYQMTDEEIKQYPPIEFVMGKSNPITVSIAPESYLQKGFCGDPNYVALAIADGGIFSPTIMGDTFMKNFENVFDRQNSRMGFAPVYNCPMNN